MFRIIFSLSAFLLLAISTYSQTTIYMIDGSVDASNNGSKVYLATLNETKTGMQYTDSTLIKDGKFSFTDIAPNAVEVRFIKIADGDYQEPILFIPEREIVTIDFSDNRPQIGGTRKNKELQDFLTEQNDIQKEVQEIIDGNSDRVSETAAQVLNNKIEGLYKKTADNRYQYSLANIQNDLGEFIFLTSLEVIPPDSVLLLLDSSRPSFKSSPLGIDIKNYYTSLTAKLPGKQYTDIELQNTEGKNVKLSNYISKGNVILLDFWASWCGPCIKTMPELVKLYNDYKDKGFEIIGISFDDSRTAWSKAITRLDMTWPQLSDLKGWKSEAGKVYGIQSIPFTLLIDKDGKIIGNNMKDSDLRTTLDKLLNTK